MKKNNNKKLIPFFVVDRPISLDILMCLFSKYPKRKWGILTHAFTSEKFKKKFKDFPKSSTCLLNKEKQISLNISRNNIIKIVDSGIFVSKREISYEELFEIYEFLDADFGVIIDHLKDVDRTLESAKKALEVYKRRTYKFKLIAVAQGNTIEEYLKCYEELRKMGYKYIAIGGLLKRKGNSSIVVLKCEKFLKDLLERIKEKFDPTWLFTFGVFNQKRISTLKNFNVTGADYKGWLFQYDTNYSNLWDYINKESFSKADIEKINFLLKEVKKGKNRKERNLLKKEIDNILRKYNLTLQEVRISQILSSLEKHLKNI